MDKLGLADFQKEFRALADPKRADFLGRFFKTGKGEYAEGDIFLGGIDTPTSRKFTKKYQDLPMSDVAKLLTSKYHEERSVALGIVVTKFQKGNPKEQKDLYKFYIGHTRFVNNWDLVDVTADKVVGKYLIDNPKEIKILDKLVKSKNLWERRISIMSTFAFIKIGHFDKTLEIAEKLLNDKEDLIHKAVGWMLREVGKRDLKAEESFLKKHYKKMPRTMLRYAIERFDGNKRKKYLLGTI